LTISARSGYFGFRKVSKSLRQLKTAVTKSLKILAAAKDSRYESLKILAAAKDSRYENLKILAAAKDSRYENLNLFKFCRNCQRALYFEKIMINLVIKYWIIAPKGRLFTFCSPTLQSHR